MESNNLNKSVDLVPGLKYPKSLPKTLHEYIQTNETPAIYWKAQKLLENCTNPIELNERVAEIAQTLALVNKPLVREEFAKHISKKYKISLQTFKKIIEDKIACQNNKPENEKLIKIKSVDRAAYFDFGFWEAENAYWTLIKESKVRICNFTIKILFFVRSENEPKYVCLFTNMFGRHRVTAITTDDFTTIGTFRKVIGRMGNFIFEGSDVHLNKIKMKLFFGVREAEEPQYMGYNQHGNFYTWANGIWQNSSGTFYSSDKYGIVELRNKIENIEQFKLLPPESHVILNGETHVVETPEKFLEINTEETIQQYINQNKACTLSFYFLPFSTKLKVTAHDDDDFEFERKFKYTAAFDKPGEKLLQQWANLMCQVYKINGIVAVSYYLLSVYRDIVYKSNNNYIPLLGFFGMRGSGKSTCARSLNRMFGDGLEDGVNLESGSTATGIRRYMASMQNAILWLNEYKNSLPDYTLGMIKGISDGSGKLTGRNTGGNETKTYKPRCSVVYCGQDFPTKDPAILSRTVICEFDNKDRNRELLDQLITLENTGVGSQITCYLQNYRGQVKQMYSKLEPMITRIVREKAKNLVGADIDDRLLLNVSSLLTVATIVADPVVEVPENSDADTSVLQMITAAEETYRVKIGFSLSDLTNALMKSLKMQVDIQHTSDDVEQYFQVLMALVERGQVLEGIHYKLSKGPDGLSLWLRVNQIHALYRTQAEQAGYVAIDIGTLRSYLGKHKAFKKYHDKNVRFEKVTNPTSAYELNYDWLLKCGIELKTTYNTEKMVNDSN